MIAKQQVSVGKKRKSPSKSKKNIQYDLFAEFLTNDESAVSNTIEFWDSIPKYFLTSKQQEKVRTKDGLAEPYEWHYRYKDKTFTIRIQPALIKQESGYKAFFPGVTEELIEETLKKIFTVQSHGSHDPGKPESWVKFSLSMVYKELKTRGRQRNRKEIKHAIEVLSSCVLTLFQDGKEVYRGSILSDLVTVNRDEYLADSDSLHMARLSVFISQGINRLQYRQFNYSRLMECDGQLTRWLYKRMVNRYTQASLTDPYHLMFSEIKQSTGLLQQGTDNNNRKKVISALNELVELKVILSYRTDSVKDGRKIKDVKYTVTAAAPAFIKEQKAASKRMSDAERSMQ